MIHVTEEQNLSKVKNIIEQKKFGGGGTTAIILM